MTTPRRALLGGLVVLALVTTVAGVFAVSLTRDPNVQPVLVGRPAPDFSLSTLDTKSTVRLNDLRGKVVALNFFASWCLECRQEEPVLSRASSLYRSQDVVLLGIAFQDDPQQALRYAARHGIDWPLLADPASATALHFGVTGVPETFLIDRTGKIAKKFIGPVTDAGLSPALAGLTR